MTSRLAPGTVIAGVTITSGGFGVWYYTCIACGHKSRLSSRWLHRHDTRGTPACHACGMRVQTAATETKRAEQARLRREARSQALKGDPRQVRLPF